MKCQKYFPINFLQEIPSHRLFCTHLSGPLRSTYNHYIQCSGMHSATTASHQTYFFLRQHLRAGKVVLLASDGSLFDHLHHALHGWKLHSKVNRAQAIWHGIDVGEGPKMSSLRPEAGGFLAVMMVAVDALLPINWECFRR